MTRLDKLVAILLLLIVAVYIGGRAAPILDDPLTGRRPIPPSVERPAAPAPTRVRRPPLAPPAPLDPGFTVTTEAQTQPTIGTAFPIDDRKWMTARHVIFECTQLRLMRQGSAAESARLLFSHPSGDLAIIEDGVGGPPLQLADRPLSTNEEGYAVGFPQGVVGAVHFLLLGRSRLQMRGWMTGAAPTLSWAEESRFPPQLAGLGGLSGGPMVDDEGRLLGVVVTATTRRGRADSIAPEMLGETRRAYFPAVGAKARPLSQISQGPEHLEQIAQSVVRDRRVGLVYCQR